MEQTEQHSMEFVKVNSDGGNEIYCPTCGRRLILYWPPDYKKVVLEDGNINAVHMAVKGGLQMDLPHVDAVKDDPRLSDWDEFLREMGFDELWD